MIPNDFSPNFLLKNIDGGFWSIFLVFKAILEALLKILRGEMGQKSIRKLSKKNKS
jgi:hypothetical protein